MILKRFLIATVTLLMLGLIGWCIISEYTVRTMSASVVLYRLAGATEQAMSDETIRLMLLERIPVGTSDTNIVAFLEANGVERDRFTSGQFFRYQVQDNYSNILTLLTSPPWIINIFCGQSNYGIRFFLDRERKLKDIIIENYTRCL